MTEDAMRLAWMGLGLVMLVVALIGIRSAQEDVEALHETGRNGLLMAVAQSRLRRWLLRTVQALVMLSLLILTPPLIAVALFVVAALQVAINLDDLFARVQIDQLQINGRDAPSEAPPEGTKP